jgi:hypothetical protein
MAYDLDEPAVRRLIGRALAAHPTATGRFLALAVGPDDVVADVARRVERQAHAGDHRGYDDDSLFLLVIDRHAGLPAAAGRVVAGGGRALDDAPGLIGADLSALVRAHGLDEGKIWDLATIAVLPGYREGRSAPIVSALLYRTFLNAGRRAGVRHVVALLDYRAYRKLALLGSPLRAMGGSDSFGPPGSPLPATGGSGRFGPPGSPSTRAVYVDFAELVPAIARQGELLRRPGSPFAGEIRGHGLRRLLTRRIAARMSAQVSSGEGLDEHIRLPALERRRGLLRRH